MTPDTELTAAVEALRIAGDALQSAADMLADQQAEYHGDRGMGVPAESPRLKALYHAAAEIFRNLDTVDRIHRELGE